MARGNKRMWAGVTLVGFAVLAGAGVVASRWYSIDYSRTSDGFYRGLGLRGGELEWIWFPRPRSATETYGPDGLSLQRVDIPAGPVVTLRQDTIDFNQSWVAPHGWTHHGTFGGLLVWGSRDAGTEGHGCVVAWPIPVFFLIAGVVPLWSGWRVRRRVRSGGCLGCGYDLSATLAPTPCPECGAAAR